MAERVRGGAAWGGAAAAGRPGDDGAEACSCVGLLGGGVEAALRILVATGCLFWNLSRYWVVHLCVSLSSIIFGLESSLESEMKNLSVMKLH